MYQLLKDFPNEVHPQLYDEGEFEPFMRANAISELDDIDGFLLDLRQLTLPKINGLQLTVKEIERAFAIPKDENSWRKRVSSGSSMNGAPKMIKHWHL